jgi:Ca2+-binding RTX toxin-like protein
MVHPGAVIARLDLGWVEDGWGFRDTLINISAASGSAGVDLIVAGSGGGWLRGIGGNDTLQGGSSEDAAVYSEATEGVLVNLVAGWAEDGQGGARRSHGHRCHHRQPLRRQHHRER